MPLIGTMAMSYTPHIARSQTSPWRTSVAVGIHRVTFLTMAYSLGAQRYLKDRVVRVCRVTPRCKYLPTTKVHVHYSQAYFWRYHEGASMARVTAICILNLS